MLTSLAALRLPQRQRAGHLAEARLEREARHVVGDENAVARLLEHRGRCLDPGDDCGARVEHPRAAENEVDLPPGGRRVQKISIHLLATLTLQNRRSQVEGVYDVRLRKQLCQAVEQMFGMAVAKKNDVVVGAGPGLLTAQRALAQLRRLAGYAF